MYLAGCHIPSFFQFLMHSFRSLFDILVSALLSSLATVYFRESDRATSSLHVPNCNRSGIVIVPFQTCVVFDHRNQIHCTAADQVDPSSLIGNVHSRSGLKLDPSLLNRFELTVIKIDRYKRLAAMSSGGVQRRRSMGSGPAITADSADLFPSSQEQRVRSHQTHKKVFKASVAERRTATQSQCYTTCSNLDPKHKRIHLTRSDFSETTVESIAYSSDSSVCNDDSLTTADSPECVISLQLQMKELFSLSPYYLDSTDKLINLPDDLIRDVFRHLSVKEIVRMGCLNRMWRSEMQRVINDGHFKL